MTATAAANRRRGRRPANQKPTSQTAAQAVARVTKNVWSPSTPAACVVTLASIWQITTITSNGIRIAQACGRRFSFTKSAGNRIKTQNTMLRRW